jgi:hypothetical protein
VERTGISDDEFAKRLADVILKIILLDRDEAADLKIAAQATKMEAEAIT